LRQTKPTALIATRTIKRVIGNYLAAFEVWVWANSYLRLTSNTWPKRNGTLFGLWCVFKMLSNPYMWACGKLWAALWVHWSNGGKRIIYNWHDRCRAG